MSGGNSGKNKYQDNGSRVVPVPLFIHGTSDECVRGVYAVMDEMREMVYIGMSRDIAASLEGHISRRGEEVCYVKVMTFDIYETHEIEVIRDMKQVIDMWILDNESTPIGNVEEWYEIDEQLSKHAKAVSPVELPEEDVEQAQQNALGSNSNSKGITTDVVSPFAKDAENPRVTDITEGGGEGEGEAEEEGKILELTEANVDAVLEKIRPFLISDGGNITVIAVDAQEGVVKVQLQGACESCSSATVTMQEGVEKILHKNFGDQVREVVSVNGDANMVANQFEMEDGVSLERCESALESIRDVLAGLGADASIAEVDEDEVIVSFRGPNNLKFGIEQTLRDKVEGLNVVTFEE